MAIKSAVLADGSPLSRLDQGLYRIEAQAKVDSNRPALPYGRGAKWP